MRLSKPSSCWAGVLIDGVVCVRLHFWMWCSVIAFSMSVFVVLSVHSLFSSTAITILVESRCGFSAAPIRLYVTLSRSRSIDCLMMSTVAFSFLLYCRLGCVLYSPLLAFRLWGLEVSCCCQSCEFRRVWYCSRSYSLVSCIFCPPALFL